MIDEINEINFGSENMPHSEIRLPASPKNLRAFVFLNIASPYAMLHRSESPNRRARPTVNGEGDSYKKKHSIC